MEYGVDSTIGARAPIDPLYPRMTRRIALSVLASLALVTSSCGARGSIDPVTSTRPQPPATLPSPTSTTLEVASTTTTPPTTTATTTTIPSINPDPRQTLVIHGVGDVALDPNYVTTFRTEGYGYAWSGLEEIFENDDLTVINMECAVSNLGVAVPKAFNFRCDPEALDEAKDGGVDVANLANNHGLDYGRDALIDSLVNLNNAGILPVGAGENYDAAYAAAIVEVRGWTIAILGFGGVLSTRSWLATEDRAGIASGDDTEDMVAAVERAARVADLVIVTVHWGRELDTQPRPDDIARAEAMVAAGGRHHIRSPSTPLEPDGLGRWPAGRLGAR